ncbi:MAG: hypothetical protein ACTSU5_06310 [Promethearchaeota archaeon]
MSTSKRMFGDARLALMASRGRARKNSWNFSSTNDAGRLPSLVEK